MLLKSEDVGPRRMEQAIIAMTKVSGIVEAIKTRCVNSIDTAQVEGDDRMKEWVKRCIDMIDPVSLRIPIGKFRDEFADELEYLVKELRGIDFVNGKN